MGNICQYNLIKEKYQTDLWKDIKNHWISINPIELNEMLEKQCEKPWFGNLSSFWENIKNNCSPSISKQFPDSLLNKESMIRNQTELNFLLPKTDLVNAFLPVLITSYFENRHKNLKFLNNLFQGACTETDLERGKYLWFTAPFKETYKKLRAEHCKANSIGRTLPIYIHILQFLAFLACTSCHCNVGLSFYLFEYMTGYLHLLGADARYYIQLLEKEKLISFSEPKSRYDKQIFDFAQRKIHESYWPDLKGPSAKKDNRVKYHHGISFDTFLINLKIELSSNDDIILAEDDPLKIAHQFDLAREAYLNSNIPRGFDEMCNPNDS